jgi:hypothetical protein
MYARSNYKVSSNARKNFLKHSQKRFNGALVLMHIAAKAGRHQREQGKKLLVRD